MYLNINKLREAILNQALTEIKLLWFFTRSNAYDLRVLRYYYQDLKDKKSRFASIFQIIRELRLLGFEINEKKIFKALGKRGKQNLIKFNDYKEFNKYVGGSKNDD